MHIYGISPSKQDEANQRIKKNASNAKKIQYNLINSRISSILGYFERLEAIEKKLTKDEMRSELATLIKRMETASKTGKNASFIEHYDEFVNDGKINKRWALNTTKKWTTLRNHLKAFNENLRYKDKDFGEYVLPRIINQKMNYYLKMLCELFEFNEPIAIIQYLNGARHEFTYPKWQVVSTHTGRKSFICNDLASGIPMHVVMKWTGHSDYKAMKPYIQVAEKTKAAAMNQFTKIFE